MPFTIVYAGTRQPLPEGMRVYGVEIGPDKLPKAGAFRCDVQRKGFAGVIGELGLPRGATPAGQLEPDPKSKYQVIAIPAAEDFGSPAEAYHALRRCPELTFADGRLPAVVVAGLRADHVEPPRPGGHVVRFRAIAKDGEELVASAIALHDAGAGPRLALPRWIEAQVRCGELATLKVFVRRLEGEKIFFEVEDDAGKPVGSAAAEVKDGEAVAQWLVPPALLPAAKSAAEEGKPAGKLRFHAIAPSENVASGPLDLLPPRAPPAPPKKEAPPAAKPAPAAAATKPAPTAARAPGPPPKK